MSCDPGNQYCGPDGSGQCIANTDWCCDNGNTLGLPQVDAYFICQTFSFCPSGIISENGYTAPENCCPSPSMVVCPDGNCYHDAQVCSTELPAAPSTAAPPPPSSTPPPPPPSSTPAPAPSSASPSSSPTCANGECAGACMEEGSTCCSDTVACASDWFCSTDTQPHCCPEDGQSYCAGAETCFKQSDGQTCCGNTLCWPGQTCAPGGDSCIGTSSPIASSSSSPSSLQGSSPNSSPASATRLSSATMSRDTFSTVLIPSTLATDAQESAALNILQTAVPQSVQSNPAGACFLDSAFTTAYTTPPWYTAMPTNAQSYFASVNAQNTLACKSEINTGGHEDNSGGLSDGAKAGVAIGSIAGAAALAALIYFLIKGGMAGVFGSSAAGAGAAATTTPMAQHWGGVTGGEGWNGITGSGGPPGPGHVPPAPPFIAAAATRRDRGNDSYVANHQTYSSPPSSPPPLSGHNSFQAAAPPPRSVSPLNQHYESPRPEMYGGRSWHASEMSGDYGGSELSTNANRLELR